MSRRARLEAWLNRRWYSRRPIWWLLPLSWLFAAGAWLRRVLARPARLGVPVVVVGNLNVGGSGKTPVVVAVCTALREAGYRPGVVSRGYGARVPGVRVLRDGDSADAVGDEPALIARRGDWPVAIGPDRVAAARALVAARPDVDVIVSDDGLQHYRLARAVEIVVVDGARGFGNGARLPAGPLREGCARLATVDAVLVHGAGAQVDGQRFRLVPGDAVALDDAAATRPLSAFRGQRVNAVAGIGDPKRFFNLLARRGIFVNPRPFPDHHRFTRAELDFGDGLPVLMTEKDAVKCASFAGADRWYVPVAAELPADVLGRIRRKLAAE